MNVTTTDQMFLWRQVTALQHGEPKVQRPARNRKYCPLFVNISSEIMIHSTCNSIILQAFDQPDVYETSDLPESEQLICVRVVSSVY